MEVVQSAFAQQTKNFLSMLTNLMSDVLVTTKTQQQQLSTLLGL